VCGKRRRTIAAALSLALFLAACTEDRSTKVTSTDVTQSTQSMQSTQSTSPLARGRSLYEVGCAACHRKDGAGSVGVGSPLRGSTWVVGPEVRLILIALHGVRGPIEVNGVRYQLEMPPFGTVYNDDEIAAILTYVRSAWGNRAAPVLQGRVAAVRRATAARGDSWTAAELLARDGEGAAE